jgi:hypothetical protein
MPKTRTLSRSLSTGLEVMTMMADTSTQNGHSYVFQLSPVDRSHRYGQRVKVSKRRAGADERIAPHNAALQTGILGDHCVLHQCRHEQRGAEWQITAIAHDTDQELIPLQKVDVVADNAARNNTACPDVAVVANDRRSLDDRRRIDLAVATDLDQTRARQDLLAFQQGPPEYLELDTKLVEAAFHPRPFGQNAEQAIHYKEVHPVFQRTKGPQRDLIGQIPPCL